MSPIRNVQLIDDKIRLVEGHVEKVLIKPGDNCVFTVEGKKVTTSIHIGPDEEVTWHGSTDTDPPFELTVSSDHLQVLLTVFSDHYFKWAGSLESVPDGWVLHCTPKPDLTRPVMVEDVLQEYRELKLQASVDKPAIERALKEKSSQPVVIANGKPPVEGKDGSIEPHFPLDEEVVFEEAGDRMNYREKRRIPIVRSGELMATIHPPVSGQPGTDVWGRPIPPKPTRAIRYRLKPSVQEEAGKIYAKVTGRPSITRSASPVLDIIPVYTVPGDVNLTTGHVRFEGDVVVLGDVMETMKVIAGQRIIIHGSVYNAELIAGGTIHIDHTVRKSKVYAGQRGVLARKLRQPLQQLYRQVQQVETWRGRIESEAKKANQSVQEKDILFHLLNNRFPDIMKHMKHILDIFEAFHGFLPDELKPLEESLDRFMLDHTNQFRLTTWQTVVRHLKHCIEEGLHPLLEEETLTMETADLSELEVHGDLVFTGKGSTHSTLSANRNILFTKPNASCRGGTLTAGQHIVAEHLGSLSGSKTVCRAGGRIRAKSIQHCDIQIAGPALYVEEMTDAEYYKEDDQTLSRSWK